MDRRRVALFVALVISLAAVVGLSCRCSAESGPRAPNGGHGSSTAVLRHRPGNPRFDDKDLQTMAATGVGTDRFLLDWAVVQPTQGSFTWPDRAVGALASHGIRLVPYLWGSPRGWPAPPRAPRSTARPTSRRGRTSSRRRWRATDRAAATGPTTTSSSSARTPSRCRSGPGRSGTSPTSRSTSRPSHRPRSTPGCSRSPTTRSRARIRRPGSSSPACPASGSRRPGTSWTASTRYRIQGQLRRRRPAPYAPNVDELGPEIEKFRAAMTKHGDGSTPLWLTELAWGSAPPDKFGLNKGLRGSGGLADGRLQD